MTASLSDVQSWNALSPMLVTVSGTVTSVRPVQPANALLPTVVSFLPNTAFFIPVQPSNAELPTDMILSVIMFSVRASQLPNDLSPNSVTLSGITIVSTPLKP